METGDRASDAAAEGDGENGQQGLESPSGADEQAQERHRSQLCRIEAAAGEDPGRDPEDVGEDQQQGEVHQRAAGNVGWGDEERAGEVEWNEGEVRWGEQRGDWEVEDAGRGERGSGEGEDGDGGEGEQHDWRDAAGEGEADVREAEEGVYGDGCEDWGDWTRSQAGSFQTQGLLFTTRS